LEKKYFFFRTWSLKSGSGAQNSQAYPRLLQFLPRLSKVRSGFSQGYPRLLPMFSKPIQSYPRLSKVFSGNKRLFNFLWKVGAGRDGELTPAAKLTQINPAS
jgi:hypothetical protein